MKLILGSKESVNSKNKDYQLKFDLNSTEMIFNESLIVKVVDETIQFQKERDECDNYLVYGKVESIIDDSLSSKELSLNTNNYDISLGYIKYYEPIPESLIVIKSRTNNIVTVPEKSIFSKDDIILLYKNNDDLIFTRVIDKSVTRGQDLKLVIDFTGNTVGYSIVPSVASYKRIFKKLYDTNYLKFYKSGFATNIFKEDIWQYNTYKDINLADLYNNFGLPITEVVLNFKHKKKTIKTLSNKKRTSLDSSVIGTITYNLNTMSGVEVDTTIAKFSISITDVSNLFEVSTDYFYRPYYVIQHKYFSDVVVDANIDNIFEYPNYSKIFNNGDVFFKRLLSIGYLEEGTNGADYPFLNNLHYLYSDIKFPVKRLIPIANYSIVTTSEELNYTELGNIDKRGRIC